ncbi:MULTISPECIES: AAA domain-containing protein [Flagellimonas]|uniref:AAA family ATPase n=2 Tax=Flagellimonas TaxID=444459 RepID=A0A3A1NM81_9FLAO|nr:MULTISPECIES: AAA domain-containing protein [Allomuricauda]NDV45266.1 AAA family ATPase [Allomuricauda sediminis]RIV45670.1 AAA family ATPase [Allomuricauda maritima]TXJ98012.1 AAA family ATPase [Allomuricauda maritima]
MEITDKLLIELQNRLKVGSRRGVHLNAITGRSRYKFDLTRLSHIDENLPQNFIDSLLSELPLKFRISWKDNVPDLNSLFEEDQTQLVRITKSFENLINQTEAIESEKGINTFGFGFPILVRRDQSDNKLTVAPILIWSLRIRRTKEFNTWEILRNDEDPIYINEVLINHLQNDSKIEIDQISSEHLDDGLIDRNELLDICVNIIVSINSSTPNNLRETFEQKLDDIKPISDKKYYEKLPLTSNNSFIDFSGLFSIFEVQKQNIINDYSNLLDLKGAEIDLEEMDEHFFQPISSIETDPSQQGILHSLNSSRNILIQGPPGTGKSQSLTAILVNALENHKKTIVVCEKRTALEVLYNALNEKGLNYQTILIKDIVKDRRNAVDSVRDRVDNSAYRRYRYTHSKETLDNIIEKSKSLIDTINKRHQKLGEKLIGNKNWTNVVGSLLAELKDNSEDYDLDLSKDMFTYESVELNTLLELIRRGQNLYNDYKPYSELSFLNSSKLVGENPFIIEQKINEDFNSYKTKLELVNRQILKYEQEFYKVRKEQLNQQEVEIKSITDSLLKVLSKYHKNDVFFNQEKTRSFLYKASSIFSKSKKDTLNDQLLVNTLYADLTNKISNCKDFPAIPTALTISDKEFSIKTYLQEITATKDNFQDKIEKEYSNLNLLQSVDKKFETETLVSIKSTLNNLRLSINEDKWVNQSIKSDNHSSLISSIENIIISKNTFFNNENDVYSLEFKWFQYYNSLSQVEKQIIDQLRNKENWRKTFLIYYLNSLLVNSANIDLPTNDLDHIELGQSLSELEKEQIKYIREYWFSKQIDSTRSFDVNNPNIAVENLYNKRASKNHKRLSLREIVKLDIDLFTTFFPIILTTPDVASNLFKGQNKYFDIVMFDEASQLKLEDNLPALLKGKQIVIAGDEHQMPPSNYFSKIFDGTIEDEDEFEDEIERIKSDASNSLLDCESLLDFASELGFDKRHLDFHYRSRHPYLIDYSNFAFYNQRLKPLPNDFDYIPIKYINVNGTYSDNSNDTEAETVLSIIENNISRLPNGEYPSVGVATFNINQRNLILSKINERRKFDRFREFNDKIVELEENGFFVKNLENIQGDERDVIILSTTYGINKEGKFAQRFGSINHQKGYKLLNVIVTRAKYKVYVCSSIPQEVFLNYKEHLIVEGSNNRRGAFYAYLAYAKAVSEQDSDSRLAVLNALSENSSKKTSIDNFNDELESPFEEEVYEALREHFEESQIIPQLQFAGFRIDLAYDTKKPGIPKIAIECDGAEYHSSQEAYLHDRHRQKILERHGFVFHRIWSTNWWRNPKKETQKLVEFIKSIENSSPSIFEDKSKTGLAFTDNITVIENEIAKNSPDLKKDLKERIEVLSKNEKVQTELFKETVELNSKVKVKYLNIDKDLKVQLVEQVNGKTDKINGIQKINIKSPLGVALKGRSVGDTVRIGSLDKYVRILEIVK